MPDFTGGTGFGKFDYKSMRLSNRDILLVIGIVVAVVITITTIVYGDKLESAGREMMTPKRSSMITIAHKLIEFIGTHSNVTHSR